MKPTTATHVSPVKSSIAALHLRLPGYLAKATLTAARVSSLLLLGVLAVSQLAQAQTPSVQLQAPYYNPSTGLWTATIGPNAQAGGTLPVLVTNVTPNGSPAVVFNGANQLTLATNIPISGGYTVITYIKPATGAGPYGLCGSAAGAFELRITTANKMPCGSRRRILVRKAPPCPPAPSARRLVG